MQTRPSDEVYWIPGTTPDSAGNRPGVICRTIPALAEGAWTEASPGDIILPEGYHCLAVITAEVRRPDGIVNLVLGAYPKADAWRTIVGWALAGCPREYSGDGPGWHLWRSLN